MALLLLLSFLPVVRAGSGEAGSGWNAFAKMALEQSCRTSLPARQPTAQIAICLAGDARVFAHAAVWRNIHAATVQPVSNMSDTFVTQRLSKPEDVHDLCPVWAKFGAVDTALRWKTSPDNLTSVTGHTPCLSMMMRHEHRRGHTYQWVAKVRGDIVYGKIAFPPWHAWPQMGLRTSIALVESCWSDHGQEPGSSRCLRHVPLNNNQTMPGCFGGVPCPSKFMGCAKDTWGLMTRAAAGAYFDHELLENVQEHAQQAGTACLPTRMLRGVMDKLLATDNWRKGICPECQLGCALNLRHVEVRHVASLHRMIVRAHQQGDEFLCNYNHCSIPNLKGEPPTRFFY